MVTTYFYKTNLILGPKTSVSKKNFQYFHFGNENIPFTVKPLTNLASIFLEHAPDRFYLIAQPYGQMHSVPVRRHITDELSCVQLATAVNQFQLHARQLTD